MNRRQLLASAAAVTALAAAGGGLAATRRKPNFIVILCDDLGYGDVEPCGGKIPTPNLMRMAREGVTLDNYYAPANLCTPSRAGLLTGRYPVRTGLGYQVILQNDHRGLPLEERTIAHVLKPDYATALVGKWHLGHVAPYWPPTRHGFDLFYGIPYSHDMQPLALYEADAATGKIAQAPAVLSHLQDQFAERALRFIEDHRDRPFFLELALSAPHLPEAPSDAFKGSSDFGAYGDVVRQIDAIVGRVLDKVRALGLEQDTLVVFTSDNGPWYEGSSGPLRDRKGGAAFDGGSHVPFFAWQPATLHPGMRTPSIASGIDLLPTFCAMAGLPLPGGVALDGTDISDVLRTGAPSAHDEIVLFDNEDVVGIRTQRWKYVASGYWRGGMSDFQKGGYDELYDLTRDSGESYSVSQTYPDVVKEMRGRLERARAKFAPFKTNVVPPVFQKLKADAAKHQD